MSGPLTGVRVIDLGAIPSGHRATSLLADYGADVIAIEPRGGDSRRQDKVSYAVFNRNKRSVILDPIEDIATLRTLLSTSDVVLETYRPGQAAKLGLDYRTLHSSFPGLVYCSVSAYGVPRLDRLLPQYEPLVHAVAGTMGEQMGHRDGPIFEAIPFASIGAAYLAVIGVLAALYRRTSDGRGRYVETSLQDGLLAFMAMYWGVSGGAAKEPGSSHRSTGVKSRTRAITGIFCCADGEYIGVSTGAVGAFSRLMQVLGLDEKIQPALSEQETAAPLSWEERELLDERVPQIFAGRTRSEWMDELLGADICAIPQCRQGEIFDDPQASKNGMVVTIADDELGTVEQVGPPIRFRGFRMVPMRPAPRLGQHTEEVIGELEHPRPLYLMGHGPAHVGELLSDVRVLDLGAFLAGPYSSRLLADLGADVIKLEPPRGDPLRAYGKMFRAAQANKSSIAMDLRMEASRPVLERLVQWANVVHHNMRPRVAERLGIDYESLRKFNPDIVYGYAPGWGTEGPNAHRQSLEPMMSGYVGAAYEAAGALNDPVYPICNSDMGNGLLGAVGMLIALLERKRSARGQAYQNPHLNAAMLQVAHIVRTADKKVVGANRLDPLQLGFGALDRLYETADGWICLSVRSDEEAAAVVSLLDPEQQSSFQTARDRSDRDYELGSSLRELFEDMSTSDALAMVLARGIPAVEPNMSGEAAIMSDPVHRKIGRVAEVLDAELGGVRETGRLVRVSDCAVSPHRLAPRLGAQTVSILRRVSCDEATIGELFRQKVVWSS